MKLYSTKNCQITNRKPVKFQVKKLHNTKLYDKKKLFNKWLQTCQIKRKKKQCSIKFDKKVSNDKPKTCTSFRPTFNSFFAKN